MSRGDPNVVPATLLTQPVTPAAVFKKSAATICGLIGGELPVVTNIRRLDSPIPRQLDNGGGSYTMQVEVLIPFNRDGKLPWKGELLEEKPPTLRIVQEAVMKVLKAVYPQELAATPQLRTTFHDGNVRLCAVI